MGLKTSFSQKEISTFLLSNIFHNEINSMNYSSDTKIQQHKIKTKCPKITPRYQTFAFQIHSLFFSTLLSFLPHYWPPLVLGFQGKIGFWLDLAMEILARGQKQEVGLGMGLLQFSCILPIKGHSSYKSAFSQSSLSPGSGRGSSLSPLLPKGW